jgi:hypothetical protein
MPKLRKMLGDWRDEPIQTLMRLIETQSKLTICTWCISYAEERILPTFEAEIPNDLRPAEALHAARAWLAGQKKLPELRRLILACHAAAREAGSNPAAQAAARACGQAAASAHVPTHSLGLAFYGAAALGYAKLGTGESPAAYDRFAAAVFADMEAALRAIAVENEPNPAKINWNC